MLGRNSRNLPLVTILTGCQKKSQVFFLKVHCNCSFLGGGSIGCSRRVWRRRGAGWLSRRLCQLSRPPPTWSHQLCLAVPSLKGLPSPFQSCSSPTQHSSYSVGQTRFLESRFSACFAITCIETVLRVSQVVSLGALYCTGTRETGLGVSSSSSAQNEIGASESGCWTRLQLLPLTNSGRWHSACPAGFRCGGVTDTGSVVVMLVVVVRWERGADRCSPQPGWC